MHRSSAPSAPIVAAYINYYVLSKQPPTIKGYEEPKVGTYRLHFHTRPPNSCILKLKKAQEGARD